MKRILIIAMLSALFVSCSNEENSLVLPKSSSSLGITTQISGMKTRTGEGVFVGEQFPEQTQIKVLATGEGYNVQSSTYKFASGAWNTATQILLINKFASVYGYYPVDAELVNDLANDDNNALNVYETPGVSTTLTGEDFTDYMYAVPNYANGQTGVNNLYSEVKLDFKHALAKLTFILNKDPGYIWFGKFTKMAFNDLSSGFRSSPQELLLKDGSYRETTNTQTDKIYTPSKALYVNNDALSQNATAVILVYPRTKKESDADKTKLTFTIDGKEMELSLNAVGPSSNWEAGNNYVFKIMVKPTGLELSSVSINQWKDIESGSADID